MAATGGENRSGWGTFAKVVGAVAALLAAVGGLLATLDAMGVIGDSGGTRVEAQPAAPTASETTPQEREAAETTPPATAAAEAETQPQIVTTTTTAPPTTPSTQPPTTASPRGVIAIRYRAESAPPNCTIFPTVSIADTSAAPSDLQPLITNVLLGSQSYSISGSVNCVDGFGNVSSCRADGSGVIDVIDGRDYYVVWSFPTTEFAVCPFVLEQ